DGVHAEAHLHRQLIRARPSWSDEHMAILRLACCAALCALCSATSALADGAASRKVSFYFVAHEDDWQLFMNPSAFTDVTGGAARTVFVHVTAGDDGLGTGAGGRKQPYYLARENGAVTAIRLMVGTDWHPPVDGTSGSVSVNGHSIFRVSYGNAVAYFLRL